PRDWRSSAARGSIRQTAWDRYDSRRSRAATSGDECSRDLAPAALLRAREPRPQGRRRWRPVFEIESFVAPALKTNRMAKSRNDEVSQPTPVSVVSQAGHARAIEIS